MSRTFFDSLELFPHPLKVRFPRDKPTKVTLSVLDLVGREDEAPAEASFEVIILDSQGYMESTTVTFLGQGKVREHHIDCLAQGTSAVYILPLQATNPLQEYRVTATTP